jgi:serine/threonine protein kinase
LKANAETSPAIDVWAIGIMLYAMIFGHLPFWGETEDEFIDKIISAPVKFDPTVPVSSECKDLLKGMMHKDPEKRYQLIDIMTMPYFIMDDCDLEDKLEIISNNIKANQVKEEEKQEKNDNDDFMAALNLNSAPQPPGGKKKVTTGLKDKTPSSSKQGSIKVVAKKPSTVTGTAKSGTGKSTVKKNI